MVLSSELTKKHRKEQIFALRRRGFSYAEIRNRFPVSKSTLSKWLRSVPIPEKKRRELHRRSIRGLLKQAAERKQRRIADTAAIHEAAIRNVKEISEKELWLMGIVLYRAHGLEETERRSGLGVRFSSSDPFTVRLFLEWLIRIGKIRRKDIVFDLYLHESRKDVQNAVLDHWSRSTGFPRAHFSHVYILKNKRKRKMVHGKSEYGLMRVRVAASSALSRQISGWIQGIKNALGSGSDSRRLGRALPKAEALLGG